MAATKLSAQDKKDLDKFTKYLVYKCIQVIVQSRLGEKIRSQSKPVSSGSDWFNLSIKDMPEVFAETKKVFTGTTLNVGQTVCVEISLRTAEGDTMVLETWSVTMTEQCDLAARVSYTVYNRMGILLKSLICVSRVTPAYRLSQKQGPETYVICYRIYMGEPQMVHLGEGYQTTKVGGVPTPIGTGTLSVSYRTKLLISPQPLTRDLSIDLKDDHFTPDISPRKTNAPRPCHTAYRERRSHRLACVDRLSSCDHEDGVCGDPCEQCATSFSTSPLDHSPHFVGFQPPGATSPLRPGHRQPSEDDFLRHAHVMDKQPSFSDGQKMGAFAPVRESEAHSEGEDVPFMMLLQQQYERMDTSGSRKSGESDGTDSAVDAVDNVTRSTCSSGKSTCSQASGTDEFVMVELKTPFAGQDANSDLGRFYRECQGAPSLTMFDQQSSVEDTLNAITDQLAVFEATAKDFDDFVENLAQEDEDT